MQIFSGQMLSELIMLDLEPVRCMQVKYNGLFQWGKCKEVQGKWEIGENMSRYALKY